LGILILNNQALIIFYGATFVLKFYLSFMKNKKKKKKYKKSIKNIVKLQKWNKRNKTIANFSVLMMYIQKIY